MLWWLARATRRWTTVAALSLLVALGGGIALAAAAGAVRTHRALPAFLDDYRLEDAVAHIENNPATAPSVISLIRTLPGVVATRPFGIAVVGAQQDGAWHPMAAYSDTFTPTGEPFDRPVILQGHLPDASRPDEVAINEAMAGWSGKHVGDHITLGFYEPSDLDAVANGLVTPQPRAGTMSAVVSAVIRIPFDLQPNVENQPGTVYGLNRNLLFLTSAFWSNYGTRIASYGQGAVVKLAHGKADFDAFARAGSATNKMEVDATPFFYSNGTALQRTVDLEALGLAIFAGLAGLAGLLLVGQALSRQVASNAPQHETLRALGLTRRQLLSTEVMAAVPIAAVGGVLSVALAVAASPLTPIGVARRAELHQGVAVELPVLLIGFAAVVVFVVARVALAAWRLTRPMAARSPEPAQAGITRSLARLGVPPPLLTGARRALDPVSKRGSGIGSMLATTVGVIAAVAAITMSASMGHLITTPRYLGWKWDAMVGNYSQPDQAASGRAVLAADSDVDAFAGHQTGELVIDGIAQPSTAFQTGKGDVGPPVLRGRLPNNLDEVAVGGETLSRLGKHVGDHVALRIVGAPVSAVVVGEVIPPTFGDTNGRLGQGVVLTTDLNTKIGGTAPGASAVSDYVVRFRPGVAPGAALSRLRTLFPGTVLYLAKSYDTEALRPIQSLPLVFVLVLALLVGAALTHIVMTDTRRRRHETGVLKAIGFTRGQSGRVVVWLALIVMAAVLVPAIPLGIGAGRLVWRLWADSLGTLAPAVVPWWTVLVIPLSLLLALAVACAPAWWTARIRPAAALRAE